MTNNTYSSYNKLLCQLVRTIVNPSYTIDYNLFKFVDWNVVKRKAMQQGISALVFDAISNMPDDFWPSKKIRIQWITEVVQQENIYLKHANVIAELTSFYESHDIKMMLLKGWGLSLNYPKPCHRQNGDIDIWLYGNQVKGDSILEKEKGIHPIKSSHHTIFYYDGIEVENHITFIEVDCHKADGSEDIIMRYANEPAIEVDGIKGKTILLPPPNLNAFFLLRHSSAHFATSGICLRHLLDWGFFVEKHYDNIDWKELYCNAHSKNMHVFLDCINAICVEHLGFTKGKFPIQKSHIQLQNRIWKDILNPEFSVNAPPMRKNFVKYCYVKTQRHFANKWKHDIAYNEHFFITLLRFAWNRIKSPYSFGDIININNK